MKKIFILILLTIHLFANTIEIAKDLFDNKEKHKEAIEIFQKFEDDAEAQYYLGKAYFYGMGVEKDLKKAFEYAKKSADKNNSLGLNLLGVMHQNGEGVKKDELKALEYYNKSADLNNLKAMFNLARLYTNLDAQGKEYSSVIKKDYEKALSWYRKAYELGNVEAAYYYGTALSSNEIGKEDEAIEVYKSYLDRDKESKKEMVAFVYDRLAWIYEKKKDYKKAYKNYKESANLGNNDAILSIIYLNDISVIPKEEYLMWMKKGVESKLELAYAPLSKYYSDQYLYYLEKKDFKILKVFLEKLYYEDKNLEMGCNLSSYYLNLLNNQPETNYEKVYEIAKEIIDTNPNNKNIYTCYENLAYLYRTGKHVSKDLDKAKELYKKSSEVSLEFAAQSASEAMNDIKDEIDREKVHFENHKVKDERIYPILNNFTKKEQVFSILESNKYFFLSVNDKSIKMYDKNNLKLLNEFKFYVSSGMNGNALQMAFDENKKLLYFSVLNNDKDLSKNDLIHVLDVKSGKIIRTLKNIYAIRNTYLNISDDGKYLIAINNKNLINIINIETNENQHYNLKGEGNFVAANIIKENEDYIVYLGNKNNGKIYKYSLNLRKNISVEDFNNQTKFRQFNENQASKVFRNLESIEIQNININDNNIIELNFDSKFKEFDLKNFKLNDLKNFTKGEIKKNSNLIINQKYGGEIIEFVNKVNDYKKEFLLMNEIKILNSYSIKNKYLFLLTSDISFMPILNDRGELIANLQGISAFPKDVLFRDNNLILLGQDNVIHIFNLSELDSLKYSHNEYDEEILNGYSDHLGKNKEEMIKEFENMDKEIIDEQLLGMQNLYKLSFTPTKEQLKNFFSLFFIKKEVVFPKLSLFIKNEKDWIIYTPEGLFTYGGNGKDLLKYHQNQGLYKEAKIIENDRLFEKFYRPDLIKKILAGEKVEIPMDVKSVILNIMPPELKILVNKMLNTKDIELTYQVCDAGNGIADAKLIINGQAINPPQSRGFSIEQIDNQNDKCKIYKSVHTLYPGKSTIEFKAYDKDMNIANISDKVEVTADYKIIEKSKNMSIDDIKKLETENNNIVLEKSNLYFLSLAVAEYEDKNYNLKYTVNDVESVKEKFVKNSKNTFENIFTYKQQDNEVSRENIDKMFDEISKKLKLNDTFVLYIAGHGTIKDGKYQFIPYKIDEKISIDNIKQNLAKIANYTNKSLVMLDTCYSGAVIENISDNATTNRLSHDNNSINYIVASSSEQVALEGYNNHGIFTYSVLDAFDRNQTLKVNVLSEHVTELVPKITQEKFHFEQRPQVKLNKNFILSDDE